MIKKKHYNNTNRWNRATSFHSRRIKLLMFAIQWSFMFRNSSDWDDTVWYIHSSHRLIWILNLFIVEFPFATRFVIYTEHIRTYTTQYTAHCSRESERMWKYFASIMNGCRTINNKNCDISISMRNDRFVYCPFAGGPSATLRLTNMELWQAKLWLPAMWDAVRIRHEKIWAKGWHDHLEIPFENASLACISVALLPPPPPPPLLARHIHIWYMLPIICAYNCQHFLFHSISKSAVLMQTFRSQLGYRWYKEYCQLGERQPIQKKRPSTRRKWNMLKLRCACQRAIQCCCCCCCSRWFVSVAALAAFDKNKFHPCILFIVYDTLYMAWRLATKLMQNESRIFRVTSHQYCIQFDTFVQFGTLACFDVRAHHGSLQYHCVICICSSFGVQFIRNSSMMNVVLLLRPSLTI